MTNFALSLIRTYVPIAVGTFVTFLFVQFGLSLDAEIAMQLTAGLTGLVIALYYGIIRLIERKYPQIGVLLGSTQKPIYVEPATVTTEQLK
jgi:hypothetical protein